MNGGSLADPPQRIGRRIGLLMAIGVIGPLAMMLWAGSRGFAELDRRLRAERELLARLVAERVGNALRAEMEALEEAASSSTHQSRRSLLRRVYLHRRILFDEVFFIDAAGVLKIHEPSGRAPVDAERLLARARAAGQGAFTDLDTSPSGIQRLYALIPVRSRPGELDGVVGAAIDPAGSRLSALLRDAPLEPGESIDVVDSAGRVVASTDRTRLFLEIDHAQFLTGLIGERRAVSGSCHGCHASGRRVAEVFAFAPLPLVPWGVVVRQPQGAAYAFAGALSQNLLLWTTLGFALALVFAYGAARSVTRPLTALTRAAERLTLGELSVPIPSLAPDEVGQLGAVLEQMRVAQKKSLEDLAQGKALLEQRVRARTAELEEANCALRQREEERRLALKKVISAQEDERRRIARELHDETSQGLSALVIGLESAARQTSDEGARRRLEDSAGLAVRALAEVHRVIIDLRPSVLDDLGLLSAIEWYADRSLRRAGVNARCELGGLEVRLPPELETALFRCAQEALTNVARHAGAENVLVQCLVSAGGVRLEVEDDGRGFDPGALRTPDPSGRGLGLLGMRERVELLGGSLTIDSAPGRGTHLILEVPLPEKLL